MTSYQSVLSIGIQQIGGCSEYQMQCMNDLFEVFATNSFAVSFLPNLVLRDAQGVTSLFAAMIRT